MKIFVIGAVIFFSFLPCAAFAGEPALIEMFGTSYKCQSNEKVQDYIEKLIQEDSDVILLNCRLKIPENTEGPEVYGQDYCNQGRLGYVQDLGIFSSGIPFVIVNGRFDANLSKIDVAVRAALSLDDIQKINIAYHERGLEISVPDFAYSSQKGKLYLYGYAPLESGGQEFFQPMDSSTGEVDGDTYVVTRRGPRVFRPVVWMEKIADWTGGSLSLTVSLDRQGQVYGFQPDQLGYVAVLHMDSLSGPVLAVGEIRAPEEKISNHISEILPMTRPPQDSQEIVTPDSKNPVTLPNQ